ncbi:prepilin-type N-terminal cleavage/methylation domain-containing protein [Verrucomicrobium spinosum]|uniref:prepilin-type N-terminal cleavage/methylation domain-containing protein n=1 Tax=Verrucomicrobium spinosum TaxID=2736 RepID=UPI0012E19C98|nr:prepilin-type N-terminal cleavage/methylation domain-containing protein [Verrucomicrobium spinosum]
MNRPSSDRNAHPTEDAHANAPPVSHRARRRCGGGAQAPCGFTLIELMLSVAILAVMVLMLTSVLSNMQNVVARSQAQVEEFEDARLAFESMARKLSQATLNSYWATCMTTPPPPTQPQSTTAALAICTTSRTG